MQSYDKNLSCANVFKEKDAFSVKTFIKLEFIICLIIKRITRFLFKGKRMFKGKSNYSAHSIAIK